MIDYLDNVKLIGEHINVASSDSFVEMLIYVYINVD